jgi:ArsR family transcriptional regulator
VVEARREGTWIYYRLASGPDAAAQHQLLALVREFGKRADLKQDVARLLRSRGPGACK